MSREPNLPLGWSDPPGWSEWDGLPMYIDERTISEVAHYLLDDLEFDDDDDGDDEEFEDRCVTALRDKTICVSREDSK